MPTFDEIRADWIDPDGTPYPSADVDSDVRQHILALIAEVDHLARWKNEALPVMDGLQELGRALDIPLGHSITGLDALAAVEQLRADRDGYRRDADRLREEVRRARVTAALTRLGQGVTEK